MFRIILISLTTFIVNLAFAADYDLLIRNGTIVDGTGAARYQADVAILDGRIAKIGQLQSKTADKEIDISGLILAPGFIDTHSHADGALSNKETAGIEGFLRQGVTTGLYGVDGHIGLDQIKKYEALGKEGGMGINFMSHIGHNAVRLEVMGTENRAPSPIELDEMKDIVKQAMDFGATGLSTGLMYQPGSFAKTEEIIELAKITAPYGAVYDSHVRDPANNLLTSHKEALDIAAAAGVEAHLGHIKAVGGKNFGKGPDIVKLVEAGLAGGQTITADLYPYDGAATAPIFALLYPANDETGRSIFKQAMALMTGQGDPSKAGELVTDIQAYWTSLDDKPELLAEAKINTEAPPSKVYSWIEAVGYKSMRIVTSSQSGYAGEMVVDLAKKLGMTPFELFRNITIKEGAGALVTLGAIQEEDIRIVMTQPWAMISSDGEETNPAHPRGRGTFPRVLGRYAREWSVLTLEDAVHKISGLPASYLKLEDRGLIRAGAIADIAIFDPETVIDMSTWSQPTLYAKGITHVVINGEFALKDGELSEKRFGRYIPFRQKN
jgi:N-acyl-D-amino-acid deacylase